MGGEQQIHEELMQWWGPKHHGAARPTAHSATADMLVVLQWLRALFPVMESAEKAWLDNADLLAWCWTLLSTSCLSLHDTCVVDLSYVFRCMILDFVPA